jgi:hypothetical protein
MKTILFALLLAIAAPSFADGALYDKKEKTLAEVLTAFQQSVSNAPIFAAASGFLDVGDIGGACPSWSVSLSLLSMDVNFAPYFCNAAVSAALSIVGIGVLFTAVYFAVRIAFL